MHHSLPLLTFAAICFFSIETAAVGPRPSRRIEQRREHGNVALRWVAEQRGIASIYSHIFNVKRMANGHRFDPRSNAAASRSLPIGSLARITNLKTRRTAIVEVADRGPYVRGRVVDLSPYTAQLLGISRKQGIARVVVTAVETATKGER